MNRHAIGIDLGGTNLKGVVINRNGERKHLTRIPTEAIKGAKCVLDNILKLIGMLVENEGGTGSIAGVGIGTPGFVEEDGRMIGGAGNLPGWNRIDMGKPVFNRFGLKVVAANDVTAAAFGEAKFGAGRGVKNMVCLALGTGVGGGIVIDGRLYKGSHGMAAELGHIVVETNGLRCNCGLNGCVEQYSSATGIVNLARRFAGETSVETAFVKEVKSLGSRLTSKDVYEFVKKGDPVAMKVHETACEMLARACGIICNSISPDRIVFGGGVMKAGQIISDEVKKRLLNHCWKEIADRTEIIPAECGEDAGVLGAAAMVFENQ